MRERVERHKGIKVVRLFKSYPSYTYIDVWRWHLMFNLAEKFGKYRYWLCELPKRHMKGLKRREDDRL